MERLTRRTVLFGERAGAAVLGEDRDDLVSVRCLVDGDGHGLHAAALNVRHRLVLAA